ncbi:hypothetical protein ACVWW1_004514 [Bradyrhizobium sp. JR3.5]
MIDNLDEIAPNFVGAILYRPKDDVDRLLADLAWRGVRVGGLVRRHERGAAARTLCSQSTLRPGKRSRLPSHSAAALCPVSSIQM